MLTVRLLNQQPPVASESIWLVSGADGQTTQLLYLSVLQTLGAQQYDSKVELPKSKNKGYLWLTVALQHNQESEACRQT